MLISLAFVNVQILLGNFFIARFETVVALAAFFGLGVVMIALAGLGQRLARRRGRDSDLLAVGAAAVLWGMVTGFLLGYFCVPDYLNLQAGGQARELSVAQAPEQAGIGYRHFYDGALRPDLGAAFKIDYQEEDGRSSPTTYRVVPVVSPEWRPGDPITLWAGSTREQFSFDTWRDTGQPVQGVLVMKGVYYRKAIAQAQEQGLTEVASAPVLRLEVESFDTLLERARSRTIFLVLIASGLWLVFFLRLRKTLDRLRPRAAGAARERPIDARPSRRT